MHKILGVGGSPRKGGNSDILLQKLLNGVQNSGAEMEIIQVRDYHIQPCIACERCRKDSRCTGVQDGMQLIYPKIIDTKGLVIVTPVYSYNMTSTLKAFIDRLYGLYYFSDERPGHWKSQLADQGRKAVIVAVGEQKDIKEGGMDLTLATLRLSVKALGYEILDELPVLGIFQKGKVNEHPSILEKAEMLGDMLGKSLQG